MSNGDLLLVDDDPDLLKLISLRLTSAGYRVRTAESGEAALFRLLIERFPDSLQAVRARAALADQRKAASSAPAAPTPPTPSAAEIVMERARHAVNGF